MRSVKPPTQPARSGWTFLTNHAHILIAVAREPHARVRDLAADVGITERAVLQILADLEEAGFIERLRDGRRTVYRLNRKAHLRHPIEAAHEIGELLKLGR